MTVNGTFQSFNYTALRLTINDRPAASPTTGRTSAPAVVEPDRVTLSPGASAGAGPAEAEPAGATTPGTALATGPAEPPLPSRTQRRADALFGALDADQDGAITKQEFTEGAIALLRRAGDRRRVRDEDHDGAGRETRGSRRLERKLEKAFGRVDANDDGAIDRQELTAALAQVAKRREDRSPTPPVEPPPAQDPAQPAQPGTTITITFTYVSIAVQRYSALQPPKDVTPEAAKDVPTQPLDAPAGANRTEPAGATLEPQRAA